MKFSLLFIAAFLCFAAAAQPDVAQRRRNFNHEVYIAMRDWDPVSYFKGSPGKGDLKINYVYKGIKYLFINNENREAFIKSPEKYEPAYGGWCAYAMSQDGGKQEKIDPATYKIIKGKLYLFFNANGVNNLLRWNNNEARLKEIADRNWGRKMGK